MQEGWAGRAVIVKESGYRCGRGQKPCRFWRANLLSPAACAAHRHSGSRRKLAPMAGALFQRLDYRDQSAGAVEQDGKRGLGGAAAGTSRRDARGLG